MPFLSSPLDFKAQLRNIFSHAGLDTSLTSTSLIQLILSWNCFYSIIMWMAAAWDSAVAPTSI